MNTHMKSRSIFLATGEIKIKTTLRFLFIPVRKATIKTTHGLERWLSHWWLGLQPETEEGCSKGARDDRVWRKEPLWWEQKSVRVPLKTETRTAGWSSPTNPGTQPMASKPALYRGTCASVLWHPHSQQRCGQPRCPATDGWTKTPVIFKQL